MTIDKEKILISRVMTLNTSNMHEVTQHPLSRVPTPFIEGYDPRYK